MNKELSVGLRWLTVSTVIYTIIELFSIVGGFPVYKAFITLIIIVIKNKGFGNIDETLKSISSSTLIDISIWVLASVAFIAVLVIIVCMIYTALKLSFLIFHYILYGTVFREIKRDNFEYARRTAVMCSSYDIVVAIILIVVEVLGSESYLKGMVLVAFIISSIISIIYTIKQGEHTGVEVEIQTKTNQPTADDNNQFIDDGMQ